MAAAVFLLGGAASVAAARLWWRRIVVFNRRLSGLPRGPFQRGAEQVTRWSGTVFLACLGLAMLVRGLTLVPAGG